VHGKRPGPSDYVPDKAYDYATTATARRSIWNKEIRTGEIDVVIKREKVMKGPADYKNTRKASIPGSYTQNMKNGY